MKPSKFRAQISLIEEFNKKRDDIYDNSFHNSMDILKEGTTPHKAFTSPINFGGYLIAYELSDSVCEQIGELSSKLQAVLHGIIKYDKSNSHISSIVYNESENFSFDSNELLNLETSIYYAMRKGVITPANVYFDKFLVNPQTVIAPGYASDDFVVNQENIARTLTSGFAGSDPDYSKKIKRAVMSHATVARFTEHYTAQQLAESGFYKIMNQFPILGNPSLWNLDKLVVGFYTMNNSGFHLEKSNVFKIKQ
jgi:hypothetical protein